MAKMLDKEFAFKLGQVVYHKAGSGYGTGVVGVVVARMLIQSGAGISRAYDVSMVACNEQSFDEMVLTATKPKFA